MISAAQIRAARALLGIDIDELSARSGLSVEQISSLESADGGHRDEPQISALAREFQSLGITFLSDGDCPTGGAGIRLTERSDVEAGIRPENLNSTNDD